MITKINNIEELEKPEIVTVTYRGHGLYQYGLPNFPELYFEVPELPNQNPDIDRLSNNIISFSSK